jgi:autotransporter-associated beta strand protein
MNQTRFSVRALLFSGAFVLLGNAVAQAGSATWNLNPSSNNWGTAANWTPATVPNGASDIATFAFSNQPSVTLNKKVTLDSIVFDAGANAYTITDNGANFTVISGAGILNNSGVEQHFQINEVADVDVTNSATITGPVSIYLMGQPEPFGAEAAFLLFENNASAGDAVITAGPSNSIYIPSITFYDSTSAGTAVLTAGAGTDDFRFGGFIGFQKSSTAANATITCEGGTSSAGGLGGAGRIIFYDNSSAGSAIVTADGGAGSELPGGYVQFISGETATSTLIVNGGTDGGLGAQLFMSEPSGSGAQPRVEVFGNGIFYAYSSITIGSLEGDGLIYLRVYHLNIGANGLSTAFSGTIQDGDMAGGSISKIGSGTLTLSGANTYTGGTTVSQGALLAANASGSATGTGAVSVSRGTLGGSGIIAGAVTVGGGTGAMLAPAFGSTKQVTLTLQSSLTLQAGAIYTYTFKARNSQMRSDLVIANGVTISGATIALKGKTQGTLTPGLVLTVISNTSANPIIGTFSNLADGAIVTVNGNNFQASYSGGDGNDLTLTVVP